MIVGVDKWLQYYIKFPLHCMRFKCFFADVDNVAVFLLDNIADSSGVENLNQEVKEVEKQRIRIFVIGMDLLVLASRAAYALAPTGADYMIFGPSQMHPHNVQNFLTRCHFRKGM